MRHAFNAVHNGASEIVGGIDLELGASAARVTEIVRRDHKKTTRNEKVL